MERDVDQNGSKTKGGKRWTKEEEKRIRKNVRRFLKMNPEVENFEDFIRGSGTQNKRLKSRTRFTSSMCYKLPDRVFNSVRCKLLSMYCLKIKTGKWSRDEVNRLFQLYESMPNKWSAIGEELNRKPLCCHNKYHATTQRMTVESCYEWTAKELQKLRRYVAKYTGTELGTPVEKDVPFDKVARKLGSKLEFECRSVWLLTDAYKSDEFKPYSIEPHEFMQILEFLARKNYTSYASIDFEHVRDEILNGRIPFLAAITFNLRERFGMAANSDKSWRDLLRELLRKHGLEDLIVT